MQGDVSTVTRRWELLPGDGARPLPLPGDITQGWQLPARAVLSAAAQKASSPGRVFAKVISAAVLHPNGFFNQTDFLGRLYGLAVHCYAVVLPSPVSSSKTRCESLNLNDNWSLASDLTGPSARDGFIRLESDFLL